MEMKVVRILGIDPGSRLTGYGIVDLMGTTLRIVTHGTLKLSSTSGRAVIPLENRLLSIYSGLGEVITQFKPRVMSIERVFFAKNAVSALKLGQARGAAILTGMIHGLEIAEYSPTEVKSGLTGHGQADKHQVAKMIELMLGRDQKFATTDASDAVALAVCHAQLLSSSAHKNSTSLSNQWSQKKIPSGSSRRKKYSLAEAVGAHESLEKLRKGR